MSNEPVMIWGTLGTLVGAVLAGILRAYAPDMGDELITSIVELVVFLVPILGGLWYARSQVDGPVTAQAKDAQIEALEKAAK